MQRTVFYSWQSDLPNNTNRGFIQKALEAAAEAIRADDTIAVDPVIDRDTQNVAGSPDISLTIFKKIESADVFVADISIIQSGPDLRPTPNPNVLLELGYAYRALRDERVILVFNTFFGKVEELPFDLRMKRVLTYQTSASGESKAEARRGLASSLESAIRASLETSKPVPSESPINKAIDAIENQKPNRVKLVRTACGEIMSQLVKKGPTEFSADAILKAVGTTQEIVADFTRLASEIALSNSLDCATELLRIFENILEGYEPPQFSGSYTTFQFDYMKFLGHEMFTTVFACLIRENRWTLIQDVLASNINLAYDPRRAGPGVVSFDRVSTHLPSLADRSKANGRLSVHADVLQERHSKGPLAVELPFRDFVDADYFLYFKAAFASDENTYRSWRPWSTALAMSTPRFIIKAGSAETAKNIASSLGLPGPADLKQRLVLPAKLLEQLWGGWWDQPIQQADIDRIATAR